MGRDQGESTTHTSKSVIHEPRPNQKFVRLSWDQYHRRYLKLVRDILPHELVIDLIVTIPRGGLILATQLSHRFDKPLKVLDPKDNRDMVFPGKRVLLVDDIVDTGSTFANILDFANVSHTLTCCLVWKKKAAIKPHFYGMKAKEESWIVFPWERFPER